jgi:uncharacterized protein involved in outer membrane biogenesis
MNSDTTPPAGPRRLRDVLKWMGLACLALLLVIVLVLALLDWNALRGPIARHASARLGRPVAINGDLQVHLLTFTPRVSVSGLQIGKSRWETETGETGKDLATVGKVAVQVKLLPLFAGQVIVPSLVIEKADVALHRDREGRTNWDFAAPDSKKSKSPSKPLKLPVIRQFIMDDAHLSVLDEVRKLKFAGTIEATEADSKGATGESPIPKQFVLRGKGDLNHKPFQLEMRGNPLIELQPRKPYAFRLRIKAADTELVANTTIVRPFDLNRLQADIKLTGEDLADLYYLTGLALPNTPRFQLAANVQREGMRFDLKNIAGKVGNSDLEGRLNIDVAGERPVMTGALTATLLDLADLAAPLGTEVDKKSRAAASPGAEDSEETPSGPLLPEAKLQLNRVRAMDADVRFDAQAIKTEKLPLRKVALHILLKQGVLELAPFALEMPQGKLSGRARIDATHDVPQTDLDARLTDVQLEQFTKAGKAPALAGTLQARLKVHGKGDSVHETATSSNGAMTVVIPHGEIRKAFAELTGINVDRGLGLLLAGDQDHTNIRCGVADFKIKDGTMNADILVFDTDTVLITGGGQVRLAPEELDLSIRGQPKKLRLVRLRSPILIGGHLRKPSVRVDVGKTALQTGVAAALGSLLTPFAAIAAFIDPGLAKDANCAALFEEAKQSGAQPKMEDAPAAGPAN